MKRSIWRLLGILVLLLLIVGCSSRGDVIVPVKKLINVVIDNEPDEPLCTDTEESADYFTQGTVTFEEEDYEDKCSDELLIEYYCEEGIAVQIEKQCEFGCVDGVCAVDQIELDDNGTAIEEPEDEQFVAGLDEVGNPIPNPAALKSGCTCTKLYNPVCGVDGNVYHNACHSRCLDIATAYKGECNTSSKNKNQNIIIEGRYRCDWEEEVYYITNKYIYQEMEDGRNRVYTTNGDYKSPNDSTRWTYSSGKADGWYYDVLLFVQNEQEDPDHKCFETNHFPEGFEHFIGSYG